LALKTKVDDFSQFYLKTGGYGSCGVASKPLPQISWFGPQNWQLWFGDLAYKITVMVSWFGPRHQVGDGLSVAPQNQQEDEDGMGHARSNDLLCLEASQARVFQFCLKTGGGATGGSARGITAEVALK
jgi:hypothetical protein